MRTFILNTFFLSLIAIVACEDSSVSSYVYQADRFVADKDYRRAIIHYQKAIKDYPREPVLYYNQAALYRKMGTDADLNRAIANYNVIHKINPTLAFAPLGLAKLYFEKKSYDDALYYLDKAITDDTYKPTLYVLNNAKLLLAQTHLELKNSDKALKYLDELLTQSPPFFEAYFCRAKFYAELAGDKDKARADLGEYIKHNGKYKSQAEAYRAIIGQDKNFDF